jgi:sugar-specific transcriptional regulator TrmB
MSDWALVFLGVIALASLAQTVFLIVLALESRRMAARIEELRDRFEKDLRPSLDNLSRITRNLAEISDLGVVQAHRVDEALSDTLEKVRDTTETVRKFLVRPLLPLADIVAFLRGVRRGIEVYKQLRGFDRGRRAPQPRSYSEDEHLFI